MKNDDKYHRETLLLLRYACERAARGLFVRASPSRIRMTARTMERAALGAALNYTMKLGPNQTVEA